MTNSWATKMPATTYQPKNTIDTPSINDVFAYRRLMTDDSLVFSNLPKRFDVYIMMAMLQLLAAVRTSVAAKSHLNESRLKFWLHCEIFARTTTRRCCASGQTDS